MLVILTDNKMLIILIIMILGMAMLILSMVFRKYLPCWYTCKFMGWHSTVNITKHDGCSVIGECTKCGKEVMLDSQGNWF